MNVPELLEKLPDDPYKIAVFFRREGLKGWRRHPSACPVGLYLRIRTDMTGIYVRKDAVRVRDESTDEIYPLPVAVQEFVRRFDAGRYKSLTLGMYQ